MLYVLVFFLGSLAMLIGMAIAVYFAKRKLKKNKVESINSDVGDDSAIK